MKKKTLASQKLKLSSGKRKPDENPEEVAQSDSDSSEYSDLEEEESSDSEIDTSDSANNDEDDTIPDKEKDIVENGPQTTSNGEAKTESEVVDEYAYDSSDEEDLRNTVGNIPMNWYDEYPHLGYDVEGNKILKPLDDTEIEDFLNKMDDPNYWRTVKDKLTGQKVVLGNEELELIQRIQKGRFPTDTDIYQPFEDLYSHEVMIHPVTSHPEHKRSFIPSLIEKQKVGKLVHAIKMGWIKPRQPRKEAEQKFYMLWDKDIAALNKRMQHYIPAPKMKLPGHEESYNPPPEYLFTKEEEKAWNEQEPEDRKLNFIPKKHSSLRLVPSYSGFISERFERCLDLYLCPRARKMRVNVDPNDLIPKLPKPRDLQPFPTVMSVVYTGHTDMVRCISIEPRGQFFASGSDDQTVKVWEVLTGRCLRTYDVGGVVQSVAWCPNEALCLLLVATGDKVLALNPNVGDKVVISNTDILVKSIATEAEQKVVQWQEVTTENWDRGIRLIIKHNKEVTQITWHAKGDYFASLMPSGMSKAVVIHKLSIGQSQMPFHKLKARVQCIQFHPLRPFFFLATQRYVRMYNLSKQRLSKKLMTNCKWVSSMAIHPQGDNLLIGSYDCRLSWFDLELSTKPYKTLRHHKKALRQVAFHSRYPLFASASDDGSLIVCHGMVYSDLLKNALIVPVKILKGHETRNNLNILDCCFHPTQPWLFSSGADATIRLFT